MRVVEVGSHKFLLHVCIAWPSVLISTLILIALRAGRPENWCSIADWGSYVFFFSAVFRLAVGPMQPLVQWVAVVMSPSILLSSSDILNDSLFP
jgi:hypothetical protein